MKSRLSSLPALLLLSLAVPVLAQSSRSGMGAVPYADASGTGVMFRTWAPNASSVSLRGSFNGWGTTALAKESIGGLWSVELPRAKAGDEYKFVVNGTYKKDPRSRRVVNSIGNSIIYNPAAFNWGDSTNFSRPWRNDLVIYQMHVGIYNAESWLPSTFDQCIEKIPYLKSLGVSAVKLMPVNEFPGDHSWGYNPSDPYAIESSFGGPDGLKRFVKACHENGLAVLIDVVHNHYGPSDLEMWQYDGWSDGGYGGIYFYNDDRAKTMWGDTRPDYGRAEVRDYVKGQIRMFLEEYDVDGFRWDSVYNIRYNYHDRKRNLEGDAMLADINGWMASTYPDRYRIAEDNAGDNGGVGFEAQWDHGFQNDVRWLATAASDSDRNMDTLAYYLSNGGFHAVRYVESHDTCGDINNEHRLPYDIDSANPNSYWAKKRALLAHTIALVSPGIPMIFAGSEMHEWYTFSNNQALRWSLTNENAGIVRAFADLIHLRRNADGNTDALKDNSNIQVRHVNHDAKVVGVSRRDELMLVVNASATARTNYPMAFPSAGTWYCLYNSDSAAYDPLFGNVGPAVGGTVSAGATASLALGAYSLQIYSKSRPSQSSAVAFDPAAPDGCGATVTLTYSPADGPLKDAATVFAFIGRNDWQGAANVQMTASGDDWTLAYTIPEVTYELNVSFTDAASLWDNNGGANWTVPVSNCGDLPAVAALSPAVPQGCVPVKVAYKINGGPLTDRTTQVYAHLGRNGWQDLQNLALTNETGDLWSGWYAIPDDTWELNFVFLNSSNVWDNNFGNNWRTIVNSCFRIDEPHVAITQPPPSTNVASTVTHMAVQGTASLLTGHLRWTNSLSGAAGMLACASDWSIAAVPLASGVNLIRVSGTNSSVNPNHDAQDAPTHSTYAIEWHDGQNGGSGFGPWSIGTGATASLAVSNPACGLGAYAWALQASDGGFIQASRPFAASLQPGDKVSFVFENGGVDGGFENSSVGVAFENRFDQRLAEFKFEGGTTNYVLFDADTQNTGIPWSNEPKDCSFEMLSSLDYRLTVNGQALQGTFADASELRVARIRFWNWNAGGGDDRKVFVGDLSVTGAPLPVLTYSSEIVVTRAASPLRQTESFVSTSSGLVATLDNASGIAGNIWAADSLANGAWNWSLLPGADYVISNNTITLAPPGTPLLKIYSIGKPGGP
ncbi:MAG: hypothetical protein EOM72_10260 [Opitutae bacterium]|nr:hypothetical protein [Opitutae bacterium]